MAQRWKQARCDYCGEACEVGLGERRPYSCGARECERYFREEELAERDEAHEQLDRMNGWDF